MEPSLPGFLVAVTVVLEGEGAGLHCRFSVFFWGGPWGDHGGTIKYKAFPLNPKHAGVFCERIRGSFVVDNLGALD